MCLIVACIKTSVKSIKATKKERMERQKSTDKIREEKKKVNVRMCPIMTSISSSESFLSPPVPERVT